MGQYYKPVLKQDGIIKVFSMDVIGDDGWNGAKLMEHSWWDNSFLRAIGSKLYKKRGQVSWVGDYSDYDSYKKLTRKTFKEVSYSKIWGNEALPEHSIEPSEFRFDNKFICNHTKKKYLDLKYYYEDSDADGWCINPLSLLTALGNGAGGGDYAGDFEDVVGTWAWDEISIEDIVPSDYCPIEIYFKEE